MVLLGILMVLFLFIELEVLDDGFNFNGIKVVVDNGLKFNGIKVVVNSGLKFKVVDNE